MRFNLLRTTALPAFLLAVIPSRGWEQSLVFQTTRKDRPETTVVLSDSLRYAVLLSKRYCLGKLAPHPGTVKQKAAYLAAI